MNKTLLSKSIAAATLAVLLGATGTVSAADDGKAHSNSMSSAVSDTAITAKVKARYMDDARLKGSDISVSTADGNVTLTGTAPSSKASKAAEELARHVDGVIGVNNRINAPTVANEVEDKTKHAAKKADRAVSDSWITTKVKSSLLADHLTKGLKIDVSTKKHVVSLAGTVKDQATFDRAIEIARAIKSVDSVDSSALYVAKQ